MRLGLSKHIKGSDLHLSRAFAGGHVFTEGVLDKLLCEAYYNPRIVQIIEMMLSSGDAARKAKDVPQLHLRPVPANLRNVTGLTFAGIFLVLFFALVPFVLGICCYPAKQKGGPSSLFQSGFTWGGAKPPDPDRWSERL